MHAQAMPFWILLAITAGFGCVAEDEPPPPSPVTSPPAATTPSRWETKVSVVAGAGHVARRTATATAPPVRRSSPSRSTWHSMTTGTW